MGVCIQLLTTRIQNVDIERAERDHDRREEVRPRRHELAAEQQHAEERRLEEERREPFVAP